MPVIASGGGLIVPLPSEMRVMEKPYLVSEPSPFMVQTVVIPAGGTTIIVPNANPAFTMLVYGFFQINAASYISILDGALKKIHMFAYANVVNIIDLKGIGLRNLVATNDILFRNDSGAAITLDATFWRYIFNI